MQKCNSRSPLQNTKLCQINESEECYEYDGKCYNLCPIHTEVEVEKEDGIETKTGHCIIKPCSSRRIDEVDIDMKQLCKHGNDSELCYANYDGLTVCLFL
jgi:hypothetical protein